MLVGFKTLLRPFDLSLFFNCALLLYFSFNFACNRTAFSFIGYWIPPRLLLGLSISLQTEPRRGSSGSNVVNHVTLTKLPPRPPENVFHHPQRRRAKQEGWRRAAAWSRSSFVLDPKRTGAPPSLPHPSPTPPMQMQLRAS